MTALFTGLAARPTAARLQRACACAAGQGDCEACRKKKLQRRATRGAEAPAPLDLARFEGGGTTLAPQWRRRLEPQFGAGFDAVRIHDGRDIARPVRGGLGPALDQLPELADGPF